MEEQAVDGAPGIGEGETKSGGDAAMQENPPQDEQPKPKQCEPEDGTGQGVRDFKTGNLSKSLLILGTIGMLMYVLLSGAQALAGETWEETFFNASASFGIFNLFVIIFFFGLVMHFISLQFQKLADIADEIDEELWVPDPDYEDGDEEVLTEEELKEEEDELTE